MADSDDSTEVTQSSTEITDRSTEPSAFAWVMSGTLGAVVIGGLAKALLDRRRARTLAAAQGQRGAEDTPDGHPS